jgi:hypothetical protein
MMKTINIILAILFAICAILQFNDPDPVFWIALYALVAAISAFAAANKYSRWVILLGMAVCIYELILLFPAFSSWMEDGMPAIAESMKAESPYIELVREFLGTALCMIALLFHYYQYARIRFKQE